MAGSAKGKMAVVGPGSLWHNGGWSGYDDREREMEYVTQCRQPFAGVMTRLEESLRLRGYRVRRSFDLPRTALHPSSGANYSVLMIDTTANGGEPHIMVARSSAGKLVFTLTSTSSDDGTHDLRAAVAEVLVELGCWSWEEGAPNDPVLDPVCGKSLDRKDAHAVVERHGRRTHLCCALCQEAFERDPERYR